MDITEIVTKQDLLQVKTELLNALKETLSQINANATKKWLKSSEVQEMLSLSASGLQNLRVAGTLPFTKLSGIIYYDYNDIASILEKNKRNGI
jgi:hypothetical protein